MILIGFQFAIGAGFGVLVYTLFLACIIWFYRKINGTMHRLEQWHKPDDKLTIIATIRRTILAWSIS